MKMLRDELDKSARPPLEPQDALEPRPIGTVTIWFDAWRYARHEQDLWRALLICIVENIREQLLGSKEQPSDWIRSYAASQRARTPEGEKNNNQDDTLVWTKLDGELNDLIDSLYRTVEREELGQLEIDLGKAGPLAARALLRLGLNAVPGGGVLAPLIGTAAEETGKGPDFEELFGILRRQRSKIYRDQVQSLEQFHKRFTELIHQWFTGNVFQQRLVIFIDDLDRCLPEHTIGVLEAIKVFFDQEGCVIILGLDHDIVARRHPLPLQGFARTRR